jgi:hypothetical protein
MNRVLFILCSLFVAVVCITANAHAADSLVDWAAIFNSDGTVRDLQGGIDAVFLPDNISAGIATDMSALPVVDNVVYNNAVPSVHDLGNGYVYATRDASQNLVLHAGMERLNSTEDTFVEFEFNQGVVGVTTGSPWPLEGGRTANDIQVRMDFTSGVLSNVVLRVWDGSGFAAAGPGSLSYASGAPVPGLPPTNTEVWDSNYQKVTVPSADSFVEASVNIGLLFGANIEYTSIVVRTPKDINLGSFRAMGYWSMPKVVPAVP